MTSLTSEDECTIAWDPKNPFSLITSNSETAFQAGFPAHPGVGCNDFELAALMKVLQYHDEFFKDAGDDSVVELSQQYRGAVRDCFAQWSEEDENHIDKDRIAAVQNMYKVMHLSDVFLPLLPSHINWSGQCDPFDIPGFATSNTIRFLRYNLMDTTDTADPEVSEMLDSAQPEQYGGGSPYWDFVEALVLQGNTERAWYALSRHSTYTQAKVALSDGGMNDPYLARRLDGILSGFENLRDVLLVAPLPGGRTDEYDDVVGAVDRMSTEDHYYMEGSTLSPTDHERWDTAYEFMSGHAGLDHPAFRKFKEWKEEYVQRLPHNCQALAKSIPRIKSIFAILAGDFSNVQFSSWAEKLCAELLYVNPVMLPRSLSSRARRIMRDDPDLNVMSSDLTNAILSIMEGNAGKAVELMYDFGGASGAALPATMVSFLLSSNLPL
jgi:hypothetical protein